MNEIRHFKPQTHNQAMSSNSHKFVVINNFLLIRTTQHAQMRVNFLILQLCEIGNEKRSTND